MTREPPKCRGCGKVLKWRPWTGKPQPPVDPHTGEPCDCWKFKNGNVRFLKKDSYKKCPYCDGYYEVSKGNENHERLYHKNKITQNGIWVIENQNFK